MKSLKAAVNNYARIGFEVTSDQTNRPVAVTCLDCGKTYKPDSDRHIRAHRSSCKASGTPGKARVLGHVSNAFMQFELKLESDRKASAIARRMARKEKRAAQIKNNPFSILSDLKV